MLRQLRAWWLSIEPLLELKPVAFVFGFKRLWQLSIEPLLELKLQTAALWVEQYPTINRTTFGIETCEWKSGMARLRCYQSNHFWNWNWKMVATYKEDLTTINRTTFGIETKYYQKKLNIPKEAINRTTFGIETEDGRWNLSLFIVTINRTTFGIETHQTQFGYRYLVDYQSNHFWNWNFFCGIAHITKHGSINRTTFGIETQIIYWNCF